MTRILHLSDPHFGAASTEVAEAFLKTVAGMKPDLTVVSGDLTMRARSQELADASNFVARLPEPRIVIPGNHDIPGLNDLPERLFSPFERYCRTFGRDMEPEMVTPEFHAVGLNSSRAMGFHLDWSEGRLSHSQLERMEDQFRDGPLNRLRILILHHPLLELQISGRAVVKPLGKLMAAMERSRIDLVMCGHFHRSQIHPAGLTDHWKSIISQAPTVCSTRLQGEPQGFHEFHFDENGHVVAIHHIFREGIFEEAGRYCYSRTDAGWNESQSK